MNFEKEKFANKMPDKSLDICLENYNEFFKTMLERQLIWKRRFIDKKERPWTDDPFFKDRKFTNVYRMLDKNSMWEIENIFLDDGLDLKNYVWKSMFFRLFNNPPTFTNNHKYRNGIPSYDEYDADEYLLYLKDLRNKGINPFTSAYLIANRGDRDTWFAKTVLPDFHKRIDELIEFCKTTDSAEKLFKYLKTFTNVADFMAFQLFNDLTYIDKFTRFHFMNITEDSATTIGPGSDLGLRLIYPSTSSSAGKIKRMEELRDAAADWFKKYEVNHEKFPYVHFDKTQKKFYVSDEPNITLSEIEQWLCEYAKYFKMKIGEGKQRNHFIPVTESFNTVK